MSNVATSPGEVSDSGHGYTLVVAVSNPANVDQLMRTAVDLAAANDGRIEVVSVVHKPATSPFLLFSDDRITEEYAEGRTAVLEAAVDAAADAPVSVESSLEVGSDVSDAILSAVEDAGADALLIGWQERPRPVDIVLGTTVDPVVRRAPCDVYVERVGTTADGLETVLLPTDGGPHAAAAADLAEAVARANDATVEVVSYVSPDADDGAREAARDNVAVADEHLSAVSTAADVRQAEDVGGAIVADAADHDLVALGATRERRFRGRVVGSVAETVGSDADPPVVIARRRTKRSLVDRARKLWPT